MDNAFFAVMVFVFAVACGGSPNTGSVSAGLADEFSGAPNWVVKGCPAYRKETNHKVICGVGEMGGTKNVSLARSGAIARARTELARQLQTQVVGMVRDHQATTTGGAEFGTAAADEQHVANVAKQVAAVTLSGTEMVDSWISSSGTFYVLVVLDVDTFKDAIGSSNDFPESIRTAVVERAHQAFENLDDEVEKSRARQQ